MSGSRWRSSDATNTTSSTMPTMIDPSVFTSVQPQTPACWSPRTTKPMPAEISTAAR